MSESRQGTSVSPDSRPLRGKDLIVQMLRDLGLEVWDDGGWVYVALGGGRALWIGAEYGASLDADVARYPRKA